MSDWSDDNPDKQDQLKNDEGNKEDNGPDPRKSTFSEQLYSNLISRKKKAFASFRFLSIPDLQLPHPNDLESSGKNDQKEHQKRMKELEDQIAAENARSEAITEKEEEHEQILQQQKQERKMKAEAAEEQHQKKLKELEEQRLKDIQAIEEKMEDFEIKRQERRAKAEEAMLKRREQSEARVAEEANLRNEMEKLKSKSEQESKEWETSFEALLKSVRNEYQQDNRRRQEDALIEILKRINDEDEQKFKALTKSLDELKNVVAIKARLKSVQNEYQQEIVNRRRHEEALVVEQPYLMILGLKNSGKSTVVVGLQNHGYFINDKIKELSYDEMDSFEEVIRKLENVDAKLYLIVIPNTVGNLDAKIPSYLFDSHKNVAILLSKSDEQIDELKKQGTFTSIEEYVKRRHDAANLGLEKVNAINIPKFTVSALRLDGTLDESYSTQEEQFCKYLKSCFNH